MLYHQVIDIGAYVLFLDEKPIEPKSAKIVLTGTEDKLVSIGFNIDFRLRDLKAHIGNILKRSVAISEEMVEWFFDNMPITRTISTSFNLNKDIFKNLEDKYYDCESIDQFLRVKLDNGSMVSPLLNLDYYELVGLDLLTENEDDEELSDGYMKLSSNNQADSMSSYLGVVSRLIFVQLASVIKGALSELFSAKR